VSAPPDLAAIAPSAATSDPWRIVPLGVSDARPDHGPAHRGAGHRPADPTPYLIDSRELEESLNEDYTALNATRHDALVFTSAPLTRPIEVTGEMSATLWAASDALDTDWTIMLLEVWPDGHAERVQDGIARARFRQGMDREVLLVPGQVERYDAPVARDASGGAALGRRPNGGPAFGSHSVPDDHQGAPFSSTLAIAVMVFQLRVVTGTPKSRSRVPR